MEIRYLGHASFHIKSKDTSLVIDPFDPKKVGLAWKKVSADLILVSHGHTDHNYTAGVNGSPFVISGPGEYEVKGIKVQGIASFHDASGGRERGKNTIYLVELEKMFLCHLGDLGHKLEDKQLSELERVDILMIPTGGIYTIDPAEATEVVTELQPGLVIPMHYKVEGLDEKVFAQLSPVEKFLEAIGEKPRREKVLKVSKEKLPDEIEVVVMGSM